MNRREAGEELYRKKFVELGLVEKFELVCRDWTTDRGRKLIVKCKTCGAVFPTWDEVLKGRQKRMLCKSCGVSSDGNDLWTRTPKYAQALDYYAQGHSLRETAELFEVSEVRLQNQVSKNGLSNGGAGLFVRNEKNKEQSIHDLGQRLSDFGFEIISVPNGPISTASLTVRCKRCNKEMIRTYAFLRRGSVICRACEHQRTIERQAAKREAAREAAHEAAKREAEAKQITREIYRLWYPPVDVRREALLNRTGVCEICGKPYTVRDYVNSCSLKQARDNSVCSPECKEEKNRRIRKLHRGHKGHQDNHRQRARKYGCEYDPSVILSKLIERDGLRCAICGKMCDMNDHSWSEYSGPMYPSIDHIIPMSKRGGHTWNNVQVAHIICNSEKGDKFEEVGA